ncbi:carbohydrate kinase family protein [Haladaptatus salinisoli]|uniref:carbohydrate kinase family protein n=1 Tax=Haladaptatus salinisoli TaxID=2884876 RepID=UPI001D0BC98A|nr:carbohydrate kinase family protein [Haladaptatus salinisoli]
MSYDELREELRTPSSPSVAAFPDGSVDTYCRIRDGDGYVSSRETFGNELAGGAESFRLEHRDREAGGQAVNMATQAHALGGRVTLFGHVDHPAFADLPYDARSMGKPASVSVVEFEGDAVMLATESEAIREWTTADLRIAAGGDFSALFESDGVCCGNLASFPALVEVFQTLASRSDGGGAFVFDPGNLTDVADDAVTACFDALADLDDRFDVVVSVNRRELEQLAGRVGASRGSDARKLDAVRANAGVSGVVSHGESEAVAATRDGTVTVENLSVSTVKRTTGAGDRFSGGLTFGLAAGMEWEPALALANACSSWRVERGTTAGRDDVGELIPNR